MTHESKLTVRILDEICKMNKKGSNDFMESQQWSNIISLVEMIAKNEGIELGSSQDQKIDMKIDVTDLMDFMESTLMTKRTVEEVIVAGKIIQDYIDQILVSKINRVENGFDLMPSGCVYCEKCIPIGEGDHICEDDPITMVLEDYMPTSKYLWCMEKRG